MKDLIVSPDINIKQALKKLSQTGEKCLIIADQNNILLGTLSDGDLRKAILNGVGIGDKWVRTHRFVTVSGRKDDGNALSSAAGGGH